MNSDRLRSILVLIATVGMIAFNFLGSTGRLNGATVSQVSARYPTLITPAGYAFSIWTFIYAGMIAFTVYQLLPDNLERFRRVRTPYILSCLLNCVWIYVWVGDMITASFIVILLLAAVLLYINILLKRDASASEYWFARGPFGLYFGWITAATIVNFTVWLVAAGHLARGTAAESGNNWLGPLLILAAALIGVAVRIGLGNYFFPLAIAWALTAIAIEQTAQTLVIAAAAAGVVMSLVAALSFVVNLPSHRDVYDNE